MRSDRNHAGTEMFKGTVGAGIPVVFWPEVGVFSEDFWGKVEFAVLPGSILELTGTEIPAENPDSRINIEIREAVFNQE